MSVQALDFWDSMNSYKVWVVKMNSIGAENAIESSNAQVESWKATQWVEDGETRKEPKTSNSNNDE